MFRDKQPPIDHPAYSTEFSAWRAVAALASKLSRAEDRDTAETLEALANAKLKELRRIAEGTLPTHYTQHRNPLGVDASASRRFRQFVRKHGIPYSTVGKLVIVKRELVDAKLKELENLPRREPRGCAAPRVRSAPDAS